MKRQLRISQIGSRGIPGQRGGVERVIEAVAPRLVELGHEVIVSCATWNEFRDPTYRGVKLRYVYSVKSKYLDTFVRSFLSTVREIFSSTDVMHFHSMPSAPLALLARLCGKKVVVTVHGLEWQREKWRGLGRVFLRLGEKAAMRVPHQTVVVGPELKRVLDLRYDSDVVYIPNGVEARAGRAPDKIRKHGISGRDYILYLGRLVPDKQCHVLIEAFRKLQARGGLKLVIAGPTWHSEDYVARLRKLAEGDPDIVFTGEVEEDVLEELYTNCYAYVLPSEVEGMSLALLDAMAFGACVVASDIAPNADVVGNSGILFRTGDAGDLARRLAQVIADPAKADALRRAAKQRMTNEFDWDKIARQWEEVYLGLFRRAA